MQITTYLPQLHLCISTDLLQQSVPSEFLHGCPLLGIQHQRSGNKIQQQRRHIWQEVVQTYFWLTIIELKVIWEILSFGPLLLLNINRVTG